MRGNTVFITFRDVIRILNLRFNNNFAVFIIKEGMEQKNRDGSQIILIKSESPQTSQILFSRMKRKMNYKSRRVSNHLHKVWGPSDVSDASFYSGNYYVSVKYQNFVRNNRDEPQMVSDELFTFRAIFISRHFIISRFFCMRPRNCKILMPQSFHAIKYYEISSR